MLLPVTVSHLLSITATPRTSSPTRACLTPTRSSLLKTDVSMALVKKYDEGKDAFL